MKDFMNTDFQVTDIMPYYVYMANGCEPVKCRATYALSINPNGKGCSVLDGYGPLCHDAGDIIFLPRHSGYHITVDKDFDAYCVAFLLKEPIELTPFVFHAQNNPKLLERFKHLYFVNEQKRPGYNEQLFSEFYAILHEMKSQYFNEYMPKEKQSLIRPALDYLEQHSNEPTVCVERLAQLCGITPEYLRRIFKSFFGMSPLQYANTRQMERAKDLLNTDLYSVSQIASMLGFEDFSQFSHKFKHVTGISPAEYRKRRIN